MKKKALIGIGAAAVVLIGLISFSACFLSESGSAYYYTQIDNDRLEQVDSRGGVIDPHGGLSYSYTLPSYRENGEEKDITFGTSRELKEGAFIHLIVMPVRGVLEWSEVQYGELPAAVQNYFNAPPSD